MYRNILLYAYGSFMTILTHKVIGCQPSAIYQPIPAYGCLFFLTGGPNYIAWLPIEFIVWWAKGKKQLLVWSLSLKSMLNSIRKLIGVYQLQLFNGSWCQHHHFNTGYSKAQMICQLTATVSRHSARVNLRVPSLFSTFWGQVPVLPDAADYLYFTWNICISDPTQASKWLTRYPSVCWRNYYFYRL